MFRLRALGQWILCWGDAKTCTHFTLLFLFLGTQGTHPHAHAQPSETGRVSLISCPKKGRRADFRLSPSHIRHSSDSSYRPGAEVQMPANRQGHQTPCWHTTPLQCITGSSLSHFLHYVGHRHPQEYSKNIKLHIDLYVAVQYPKLKSHDIQETCWEIRFASCILWLLCSLSQCNTTYAYNPTALAWHICFFIS